MSLLAGGGGGLLEVFVVNVRLFMVTQPCREVLMEFNLFQFFSRDEIAPE